jgi:anti-sigma factor RsiW
MSCDDIRDRLTSGNPQALEVSDHLEHCDVCARYAAKIGIVRQLFREHHGNVEPDGRFAGRVAERLHRELASTLGWAAVRILPATFAVLMILAWLSWQVTPDLAVPFLASPTEDPLGWVLDPTGFGS